MTDQPDSQRPWPGGDPGSPSGAEPGPSDAPTRFNPSPPGGGAPGAMPPPPPPGQGPYQPPPAPSSPPQTFPPYQGGQPPQPGQMPPQPPPFGAAQPPPAAPPAGGSAYPGYPLPAQPGTPHYQQPHYQQPPPQQSFPGGPAYAAGQQQGSGSFSQQLASANRIDLALIGVGAVLFLLSFLPYYTVDLFGYSDYWVTAWNGFFGWFGVLAAIAGSALTLLSVSRYPLPVPAKLAAMAAFALAALCILLALPVFPGGGCSSETCDSGHGVGYWLSLLIVLPAVALAALRWRAEPTS